MLCGNKTTATCQNSNSYKNMPMAFGCSVAPTYKRAYTGLNRVLYGSDFQRRESTMHNIVLF